MARRRRVITEEEVPEVAPILDNPDDETLDYALRQFDDRNGLELKYYLAQPGGSAFVGSYPDMVPEAQLQEWYPQGAKFEIRIYINHEFRDRKFMSIAPRPGGPVAGGGGIESMLMRQIDDMRQEMRTMRNTPQSSVGELAAALKALSEIQGPKQNDTGLLEAIKLGISLSGGKVPNDEDDSFSGIAKSVLKEAGPAILTGLMSGRGNPQLPPQIAAPQEVDVDALKKMGIAYLKKKALAGADPELYIAFALDNADDAQYQPILRDVLTSEFDVFTSIDGEIAKNPILLEWFRTLYNGIRSAFAEANPVAANTGGKDGNVTHIGSNGSTRKAGRK